MRGASRLRPQDIHLEGKHLQVVEQLIDGTFQIEHGAGAAGLLATVHGVKRDSGVQTEGERLGEVAAVDASHVGPHRLKAQNFGDRRGDGVGHAQRLGVIVAEPTGMTARTGRSWGARAIRPFTTSFTRPSPPSAMTQPTSGPSSRASDSPWPAQAVVSIPKRPSPTRSRRSRAASEAATAPRPLFDTGFAMRTILPSSMEGTTTSLLTKQPTQRRPSDQPSADLRISRCTLNKATRSFPSA